MLTPPPPPPPDDPQPANNLDRQLRHFLAIADAGSISRAADQLDATQPGLSRQLARLEHYLGEALFIRGGHGVELTVAGERLRQSLTSAYRTIDRAVDAMRQANARGEESLRLAAVHTLNYYFVPDVIGDFIRGGNEVRASILARSSPEVVELVVRGRVELGFVYDTAVDTADAEAIPLFVDTICMIVREDSPLQGPLDLTRQLPPLVGFPAQYALRRMIHSSGLRPTIVAEADTVDAMLQLVANGVGNCLLPARIPERHLHDFGLRKVAISAPLLQRQVVAIKRRGVELTATAAAFLASARRLSERLAPAGPYTSYVREGMAPTPPATE